MSLVEQALRRMRQNGASATEATRRGTAPLVGAFGRIVDVRTRSTATGDSSDGLASAGRFVAIDQGALRSAGLLPPEAEQRKLAQQYRQIKRPLIKNALNWQGAADVDGRMIMMASARPGEGKTFMAINLAFSMALDKDVRIVLVDADVAKPHISRLLGLADEPGLLDALRDAALEVERLVLATDVPGLWVLPSGTQSDNATELLASERMRDVCRQLTGGDSRRIIVLDSPPLLLTTEAKVLAGVAGQVVVVVRAGTTPQQDLLDALSHLGEAHSVALVLNQSLSSDSTGYYHGYGDYHNA